MTMEERSVVIAGREYKIGQLCWEQLRVVMPIFMELDHKVRETAEQGTLNLTTDQYDKMIEAVYEGLRIDNPELKKIDLLRARSGPAEMYAAFIVVRWMTGAWEMREVGEQAASGEAQPTVE